MRVQRPMYTKAGKDGTRQTRKSACYHVHVKVRGEWRRLPAFPLRGPSEALGRRIEKLAALRELPAARAASSRALKATSSNMV